MLSYRLSLIVLSFNAMTCTNIFAQDDSLDKWHHNSTNDPMHKGISTNEAYQLLKDLTSKEVIVAVIDTGVDHLHEDLNDIMWKNPGEIPGNNIDDDGNGYIDDIHGWNFLGNNSGENVNEETLVETRIYAEHYGYNGTMSDYKNAVKAFHKSRENLIRSYDNTLMYLNDVNEIESIYKDLPVMTEAFISFEVREDLKKSKDLVLNYLKNNNNKIEDFTSLKQAIKNNLESYKTSLEYYYNPEFNSRTIVGDNYMDYSERYYGNNNSKGPSPGHGTHVAGIIAAERNNNLGIDGIANNVRIMSVRVVPNGDEHDKDVANGIRYAVDNGATIINMSFGKAFSWNKQIVDEAVRYAEKHDVLLVHAAGNSAQELTGNNNFPNQIYAKPKFLGSKQPKNWIEVGASTYNYNGDFVAYFSNFDSDLVDIFAPGFQILSTTPESTYTKFNGTSMASPMVSGVAALIRGYFPKLSAKEVKEILLKSATPINLTVKRPSDKSLVPFSNMCKTGAILNAEEAIKLVLKK